MRYDDPATRDALAAEYALGTMHGAARKRFESIATKRSDWQQATNWWTYRLHLLADAVPAIEPRKKVWQNIQARLYGNQQASSVWSNWWRGLALGSSGVAAALAFLMMTSEPQKIEVPVEVAVKVQAPATVALLVGEDAKPGWLLALAKNKAGQPEIRATALASLKQTPDKSLELWILPSDKSAPISLGVLPQQGNQQVVINEKIATLLVEGGLAVSLEPIGGSPTGQPTGAVLYQGKLTQI